MPTRMANEACCDWRSSLRSMLADKSFRGLLQARSVTINKITPTAAANLTSPCGRYFDSV
jgi:hypothetical protein